MSNRTLVSACIAGIAATVVFTALAASPADAEDVVADSSNHGMLVAAATASPTAARTGPQAVASLPRGIVVTGHDGQPVSLFASGQAPIRKSRPGKAPATFTGLKAGTAYTVVVGAESLGLVTAIDRPAVATRLLVHALGAAGTVTLTWKYVDLKTTGGSAVSFMLSATSPSATSISTRVARTRSATLSGLDSTALYTFSVTASNSAGKGLSTTAGMTKTLAQLAGPVPPTAPVPTTPAPSPTPTATSAPAPAPSTTTIYVCPDTFVEASGVCRKTMAYTYHTVTQTAPFSYHSQFIQTSSTWRDFGTDWSGTTCPYGGTMHDGHCVGWDIQGVTTQVKDDPPSGWLDDGTSYVRDTQVKDAPPAGYADDGSQWVRTVAKEARVVAA